MFQRLIEMFTAPPGAGPVAGDGLQVAVAALLIEAARTDDAFDGPERAMIRTLLADRFGLSRAETDRLVDAAADAQDRSVGLYRHIRHVTDAYDADARIGLIEMLWEVAYADGRLDPQEERWSADRRLVHAPTRIAPPAARAGQLTPVQLRRRISDLRDAAAPPAAVERTGVRAARCEAAACRPPSPSSLPLCCHQSDSGHTPPASQRSGRS
jgi:uncharacterized tellurite resistance protein B-like protein